MTTLNDLRQTLDQHAEGVPLDAALLADVRARAGRLRHRRRIRHGTALVAAILIAAVTVPLAVRPKPHPPVTGPPAAPQLWATAITMREGSKYQVSVRETDTVAQWVQVHGQGAGDALQVLAVDPGAFDPALLRRGEPVQVGGPQAWYVAKYAQDAVGVPVTGPVIGWRDAATGAWVLVAGFSAKEKAGMVEVARDVRLTGSITAVSPVSFRWMPPGLGMVQTDVNTGPATPWASFGLGFGGERGAVGMLAFKNVLPFHLDATVKDPHGDWSNFEHDLAGRTPKVINGAQVWYLPGPNRVFTGTPAAGADMVVAAGDCQIGVHVTDRNRITEADLDRMLGSATFAKCADAAGWRPLME